MPKKPISPFTLIRHYLFFQLFFYFSSAFILILFLSFLFSNLDDRRLIPLKDDDVTFLKQEITKLQNRYNFDEIFEKDLAIQSPSGLDLVLVDKQTNVVSGMEQTNIRPLLSFLYQTEETSIPMARSFDDLRINGPFAFDSPRHQYNIYFLYPVKAQKEWINHIYDNPMTMIAILLAFVLPAIFLLSWKITRPLKTLRQTANSVAYGSLVINPEIESQGITEFREVGRSLNYMIRSLQASNDHQQRLLSDISHELKTPLARLQLATAILKRKNGETSETQRIENEIQKMNSMVLDLLSLSKLHLNQHLTHTIFPIEHIWNTVLEDAQFETEQHHLRLIIANRIPKAKQYKVNGNANLLASAMENVIRNAQKYAKSIIKVEMSIKEPDGLPTLQIKISDNGPGVPEKDLAHIFRPFYRIEEDRARQSGGTGLGLTIVANALQQHHGNVKASIDNKMGGLCITLTVPLWVE